VKHDSGQSKFFVYNRPGMEEFAAWILQHFEVVLWSSARRENMLPLVKHIFGDKANEIATILDQSSCGEDGYLEVESDPLNRGQRGRKPRFTKPLTAVWEKVGEGERVDLWTTLLIDDSEYKAEPNPQHTAVHPPEWNVLMQDDTSLMPGGKLRKLLEKLRHAPSVPGLVSNYADSLG